MSDRVRPYQPTGPVDPVAAQIGTIFGADTVWQRLTTNPVAKTRAALGAATQLSAKPPVDHVETFRVPVTGDEIDVRFYRPGPQPPALIIWAHGGGFTLGSVDETDGFARALAVESRCAIASIGYRLAPEHKFPTAVYDVLEATRWLAERRRELVGDIPLILGGDSAGANLATVVTRKFHEAKTVSIAGNVLAYPCTDNGDAESLRRFDPPFLKVEEVRWFFDQYLPDAAAHIHPDFAPLRAPNLELLPPTLILTAEHDILTEQAEAYGSRLAELGVKVQTARYPGMIHGFVTMEVFFPGAAGEAMREISNFAATVAQSGR